MRANFRDSLKVRMVERVRKYECKHTQNVLTFRVGMFRGLVQSPGTVQKIVDCGMPI